MEGRLFYDLMPHLREVGGNIINVASVMGIVGAPYGSIYGASKAAVMSLTRSHALEFGSAIRVNSVVPGGVDTDMLRSLAENRERCRVGLRDPIKGYRSPTGSPMQ